MVLVTLQGHAQLTKTATFDFQHPTLLSPPVTPSAGNGNYVVISNYTFTDINDGHITLSFDMNDMYGIAELYTRLITGYPTQYYIGFSSHAKMKISAKVGSLINKIVFTGSKKELKVNEGTFDFMANTWTAASGSGSSEVIFSNPTSAEPQIMKIDVYYTTSSEIMEPSKVEVVGLDGKSVRAYSAAATEVIETTSFKSLNLTFPNDIAPLNLAAISMKDDSNKSIEITPVCSGKVLSITAKTPITEDGDFSITVPARSVKSGDIQNKALPVYHFKVRKIRNTLTHTKVVPEEYEVRALPEIIKLSFGKDVKLITDDSKQVKMYKNGEPMYTVDMSIDEAHKDTVLLKNSHGLIDNSETNLGEWTIVIPDSLIHTVFQVDGRIDKDDYWNPVITLRWKMVDPLHDKRLEVIALQTKAVELYEMIGKVGYPEKDDAINPLLAVKDKELSATLEGLEQDIAALKVAIKAFYDCTAIALPAPQKWYTIASVNKDNVEIPLSLANGGVTIGGTPVAFQIESVAENGTTVLRMKVAKDEKGNDVYNYLHVPVANNNYIGMSNTNVVSEKNYLNNLTLGKMLLSPTKENASPDQSNVAGLITIKGPMGNLKSTGEAVPPAYAMVTHGVKPVISTDPGKSTLLFMSDSTHAFRFVETVEPQIKPDVPPVTPTFFLSEVNAIGHTMTLTVGVVTSATLSDTTKVKIKQGDLDITSKITAKKFIETVEDKKNQFTIHLDGLESGSYSLLIGKGTFKYPNDNVSESNVTLAFTIPAPSFTKGYEFYSWPLVSGDTPLQDTVLNEIYLFIRKGQTYQDMCIDSSKTIELIDGWNDDIKYREGKLELFPRFALPEEYGGFDPDLKAYIIRWNPAIQPGEYNNKPFLARVVIPEACLGNEVFGQWLAGIDVKEADCIVNNRLSLTFKIDNENAVVAGDVNGDGSIDVADIASIIDVMSGSSAYPKADVNSDGVVDVADIATVIDIMAK